MDGYSVEEAAEVLGIPQGRVWELIARGVLAGVSEGRTDMRVFLRPPGGSAGPLGRSDPLSSSEPDPGHRGNGGTAQVEASPFRELLTEFRNLTERYGQALLALGEARGEVAALRSRVDLLEARMDMRLPLRPASTVAWELPDRYAAERPAPEPGDAADTSAAAETADASATAEPAAPVEREVEREPAPTATAGEEPAPLEDQEGSPTEVLAAQPEAPDAAREADHREPEPPPVDVVVHAPGTGQPSGEQPSSESSGSEAPKRRVTGGRAAIAGLAEALARAEDPALADLPGAREAAEAMAALQREARPSEPEAAEVEESAAEEAASEEPAAEEVTAEQPAVDTGSESVAPEVGDGPAVEEVAEDIQAAFAPPIESEEEPEPTEQEAVDAPVSEVPTPTVEGPASPYTTEVVEPDWFADGDFTWLDVPQQTEAPTPDEPMAPAEREHVEQAAEAPAVEAIQEAFDEPDAAHAAATEAAWPEADRHSITGADAVGFNLFRSEESRPSPQAAPPPAEEELLWLGDEFGAAELEVAAPGWRAGDRPPEARPGATVAPNEPMPEPPISDAEIERLASDEGWNETEIDAIRAYLGRSDASEPATPGASVEPPPPDVASEQPGVEPAPPTLDQDWLRGRRGPAATAYRRLRRLIQG